MNPEQVRTAAALRRAGQVALPAVLAILVTLVVIRESMVQGRLAAPPVYDDVAYMMDGAGRLTRLYDGGVPLLAHDVVVGPPHSPFSTGLAMAGFALFGMQDWAPYAMNALVAGMLLGLVAFVVRRESLVRRVLVLVAVATVPVVLMSVREFRPDIAAATLMAWGVAVTLDPPGWATGRRRALLVGAIFGATLLTKTSTAPVTLAVFGLTILTGAAIHLPADWARGWWRIDAAGPSGFVAGVTAALRRLFRALMQWAGAASRDGVFATLALVAVSAPYYGLAWDDVYAYIYDNMFGHRRELWARAGDLTYHTMYYLTGPGGEYMLGRFAWPLVIAGVLGLGLAWARGGRRWRLASLGLAAMIGLTYAVSAANPMKQNFLGLPFQVLLLLSVVLALRLLIAAIPAHAARWGTFLLCVVCVVSLASFRFPNSWGAQNSVLFREHRRLYDEVYSVVRRELGQRRPIVLVTFTGQVNATNLQYRSIKDGSVIQFRSHEAAKTVEDYDRWLNVATIVVAAQSQTGLTDDRFPSAGLHDAMVERLDRSGDFVRVASLDGFNPGRGFMVYRRVKEASQATAPDSGVTTAVTWPGSP